MPSGTLWAKKNIGATLITDAGLYFAWGELVGYTSNSSHSFLNNTYDPSAAAISANLSLSQDAARSILGSDWRMPTSAEFTELINNCNHVSTTLNGVNGVLLTSKINGKSIFFPQAGHFRGLACITTTGRYWSSTYSSSTNAYRLSFWGTTIMVDVSGEPDRYNGCPIRAVKGY